MFVPDATRAAVRGVATSMLPASGVEAVLVSTAHLAAHPGTSVVSALGGIRSFMSWAGPVVSDSGGYQVCSLMTSGRGLASVSDAGYRVVTAAIASGARAAGPGANGLRRLDGGLAGRSVVDLRSAQ